MFRFIYICVIRIIRWNILLAITEIYLFFKNNLLILFTLSGNMGCPLFCAIFILFWRFENHLWHCVEIIPYYYVECENCRSKSAGNKTVAHNLVPNNRFSDPDGLFLLSWFGIVLLFFLSKQLITQSRRHVSYALTVCTVRATSLFLFACDMSWIRG